MKFLVTGLGSIGIRHARNLIALGHEVYGEDVDTNKVEAACHYDWVKRFSGDLLKKIEANIIATPTSEHANHLAFAVSMGWHCLVEKPIAEECNVGLEVALALAKKKNLVVMVGNNQRFRACVHDAKRWLGNCGESKPSAMFTLSQHNIKYTDHVILNWGAHELDLARYLLGPCEVEASVGYQQVADIVLRHNGGCQTNVHLDYFGKPETREFKIVGNGWVYHCDLVTGDTRIGSHCEGGGFDTVETSYVAEIKAFIDRITGKEDLIGATGEDGLETLKLITAAMEMAK